MDGFVDLFLISQNDQDITNMVLIIGHISMNSLITSAPGISEIGIPVSFLSLYLWINMVLMADMM